MSPLGRLNVILDLSNSVCHECLPSGGMFRQPAQDDFRVSPGIDAGCGQFEILSCRLQQLGCQKCSIELQLGNGDGF